MLQDVSYPTTFPGLHVKFADNVLMFMPHVVEQRQLDLFAILLYFRTALLQLE